MQAPTPSQVYYVRSSKDPNVHYVITEDGHGALDCSCPDRQYRRNFQCKHVQQIQRGCGLAAQPKAAPTPVDTGAWNLPDEGMPRPVRRAAITDAARDRALALQV